jgi:hypothetical protein
MAISGRERTMLIVLGVVAVGSLAFFLLTRGGEEPEPDSAPTPPISSPPPPVVEPPSDRPERPTFAFFGGRDPFVPLVVPQAAGEPAPEDAAPPVDEVDEDGDRADGDVDQDGVTMGGRRVSVIDVLTEDGRPVVQVQVDGETFVVGEGDRFAGNFEVVSIDDPCATFLFGDETFTLCEPGERK